jgi:hypothetical protein
MIDNTLVWLNDIDEESTTAFITVSLLTLLVCVLGFIAVLSDLLIHKAVRAAVMFVHLLVSAGLAFLSNSSMGCDEVLYLVVGVFVSSVIWDSRNFIIDSFKWHKHLMIKSFYIGFPVYIILTASRTLGHTPDINLVLILIQVVSSVILSEVGYSVCRRRKYLFSAWRAGGGASIRSYESQFSSTLTTPTSDRTIRI